MKKLIKWIMGIIITLVVLVIIAAVVLPLVIDPNDYKDSIENKIKQQIGRQAHLDGEIQWSVFPWIALTFNDVSIDNEKGFKGESLANIQQLSARVKLLPLLRKNIEVGHIIIDGAEINLQIAKNGNSNWQKILTHLKSDTTPSSETNDENDSSSLNIAGVSLQNINLNYTDTQTNTKANISKLALTIGEISASMPTNIDSSMHINMPETGLDVDFSTEIIINNLLSDTGMQIEVNDFTIFGKMSGESTIPLKISLQQKGHIDLSTDTLSLQEILISAGDARISSNLTGKNMTNNMQLSGSYQLSTFDFNSFVSDLTGSPIVSSDVLSDFSSTGTWSLAGSHLQIAELNIKFDETIVKGSADIKNLENMKGIFNLHINKLNIDDFLGDETSSENTTNAASTDNDAINFGHLTGAIKIDSLSASGTTMDNIDIQVKTNNSKMSLSPIKADFYQGSLVTAVEIDTAAKTNKVQVLHQMSKIQAGPLLTDLAGSELLTGIGNLDIDLKIDEPFSEVPLKTAHGKIDYRLGDGAIYGVDVFGMMKKGLSMLYPELKQDADDGVKKTTFALMQFDADINAGILTTNILKIESPYLQVTGDVTIDLINMTINGYIEPMLLDIPDQLVSDKYKMLLNLAIPVNLSGSLLEPTIKIDAKKLLLATQKERINKEKEKLKGKLLDSLFGKNKNNTDKSSSESGNESEDNKDEKPKKKESDKDKLKKKLLKGLFGDGG
ncbi:MAG: AsmA family protein [Alcanivoracaceae bacterium]|nr:AsmA family protein [Alcanivoracaceae bacterium]